MSTTVSAALSRYPLLCAISAISLLEIPPALLSHYAPSFFPIEYADVYSVLLAMLLTITYYLHSTRTLRQSALLLCVTLWGLRLSTFLALRVHRGFRDSRLDIFRGSLGRAARWCFAQALWISVTLLPVWIGMSAHAVDSRLNALDLFALGCFAAGLMIEVVADGQKAAFIRANSARSKAERKPACDIGLFRHSRFPNYFGEWVVWTAICLLAWQAGGGWMRMLLPVSSWFVAKIFLNLSIPLAINVVRKRATEQQFAEWSNTSLFVPLPQGRNQAEITVLR